MSETKSSQGSQTVQTVLVIVVSVLITALFVLLWGGRTGNGTGSSSSSNRSSDAESAHEIADRLVQDSSALNRLLKNTDGELANAQAAKEAAEAARDGLIDNISSLKQELTEAEEAARAGSSAISQLEGLRLAIDKLEQEKGAHLLTISELRANDDSLAVKQQNTKLLADVANLRDLLEITQKRLDSQLSSGENADILEGQLVGYKTENQNLQKQIDELKFQLNRSRLFVEEGSSLNPRASKLFGSLKALGNIHGDVLSRAYTGIETTLNVNKVHHVKFAEGSAFVSDVEAARIQNDLEGTDDNSYFLVVGYASEVGSADINRTLSAKRATATAASVLRAKKPGQDVRAVYLGQTDRFSTADASENQICEIWEIRE